MQWTDWTRSHPLRMVSTMSGQRGNVELSAIDQDEGGRILDSTARRLLNMSGDDFLDRWQRGDTADLDHVAAMKVAMLIPLAR